MVIIICIIVVLVVVVALITFYDPIANDVSNERNAIKHHPRYFPPQY